MTILFLLKVLLYLFITMVQVSFCTSYALYIFSMEILNSLPNVMGLYIVWTIITLLASVLVGIGLLISLINGSLDKHKLALIQVAQCITLISFFDLYIGGATSYLITNFLYTSADESKKRIEEFKKRQEILRAMKGVHDAQDKAEAESSTKH